MKVEDLGSDDKECAFVEKSAPEKVISIHSLEDEL